MELVHSSGATLHIGSKTKPVSSLPFLSHTIRAYLSSSKKAYQIKTLEWGVDNVNT